VAPSHGRMALIRWRRHFLWGSAHNWLWYL